MERYLTELDYQAVIAATQLEAIQQSNPQKRELAEDMAIDEIKGYLRDRFDVDSIFAERDSTRSQIIVMITIDITLYHLISWLPQKMGYELRKERYDNAIKWLTQVQKGTITPDLAVPSGDSAMEDLFGSEAQRDFTW